VNQKERMIRGELYNPNKGSLPEERMQARKLIHMFNMSDPEDEIKRTDILKKLLGKTGKKFYMEQPIRMDYGSNIEVGENFYSNYNCTILDCGRVIIGDNVMMGPNVSLYAVGHPLHPDNRNSGYEYAAPIKIGNNVWLGGNVVVNPGVTIGNNVVIGSGSVVTIDIPDNILAAGNPCRNIRQITEDDRKYYFKNRLFFISEDE